MNLPWLSLLIFLPFLGCLACGWMPGVRAGAARAVALGFQVVVLLATLAVTVHFETTRGGLQFVERHAWIPTLGVEYFLGLDGLGLVSVWLAALVPLLAVAVGEPAAAGRERVHYALVLGLQAGLVGSLHRAQFLPLVPVLGAEPGSGLPPGPALRRALAKAGPASFQFFVYTMVGSATLLLGFLALRAAGGSFDFVELAAFGRSGRLAAALAEQVPVAALFASPEALAMAVFLGEVLLGFAVKVPLWPFHTWLPDTYTAAPSTVTMLLTGAMSKMGVYGVLPIVLPIFPDQFRACQGPLVLLALATVVLPALTAFAQSDLKRMLAYSSVNHLGYCLWRRLPWPRAGPGPRG